MGLASALTRLSAWLRWQCPNEIFGPSLMAGVEITHLTMRSSWALAAAVYGSTKRHNADLREETAHRMLKGCVGCDSILRLVCTSDLGIAATPN